MNRKLFLSLTEGISNGEFKTSANNRTDLRREIAQIMGVSPPTLTRFLSEGFNHSEKYRERLNAVIAAFSRRGIVVERDDLISPRKEVDTLHNPKEFRDALLFLKKSCEEMDRILKKMNHPILKE